MRTQALFKRLFTSSCALLALLTIVGCTRTEGSVASEKQLARAKQLIDQGNYEAAFMQLNQALEQAPKDPGVHLNLGWLYLYTDNPANARLELTKVEQLSPELPESYHLQGALLNYEAHQLEKEQPRKAEALRKEAITNYRKALALSPKSYPTYYDLAAGLSALKRHEEALEALNKGFEYIPNAELETQVNFQIASCAAEAELGLYDDALADCEQAKTFTGNPLAREAAERLEEMIENLRLMAPKS